MSKNNLYKSFIGYLLIMFFLLVFVTLISGFVTDVSGADVEISRGLSDTATVRAWDHALQKLKRNEFIEYNSSYDTPTADQLFMYFQKHEEFSITIESDTTTVNNTVYDVRREIWKRNQIPNRLEIEELFRKNGTLFDYRKEVLSGS